MGIKIGNLDISYFKLGGDDVSIYLGNDLMYPTTPPTPTGSTCYEIISTPITSYTSTTYDSVYSFADLKWYMKNNLNQYEEYGIYDTANTLSDLTYYDDKLAFIGTTEYQYSGDTWVSAGTYVTTEVTYDIPNGLSTTYQGQTIPTTFKISVADMNVLGTKSISIYDNTNTSYYLQASKTRYIYYGSKRITGAVTSDSDYYYFTLTDAKPSIEIYRTRGFNGTVHIIAEQSIPSVLYQEKDAPLAKVYSSVAAMETEVCPTVGVGQYGVVGSDAYQFNDNEEWDTVNNVRFIGKYSDGTANVLECDSSSAITSTDTKPSYIDYSGMTEAIIGDCTTSIGGSVFQNCTSLSSITIPSGVTFIGASAFHNCTILTNITIPNSVTSINQQTFAGCSSLTSINISTGVTSIGQQAFQSCASLTSIDIPSSVTSIGTFAFVNCRSVTSITVDNNNVYDSRNNCNAIIETSSNTLLQGCVNTIIPNNVTTIYGQAFQNCTSLSSITIPNSVTSIGGNAFRECTSLTSCTIGNGVTNINVYAFYNCSSLTSVTVNATTPPTLGDDALSNTPIANGTGYIYVPSASVNTYKSASGWSTYASRIQAM